MGKSWKQNARNDKWRKQKQQKMNKGRRGQPQSKPEWEQIVDYLADEYDQNKGNW